MAYSPPADWDPKEHETEQLTHFIRTYIIDGRPRTDEQRIQFKELYTKHKQFILDNIGYIFGRETIEDLEQYSSFLNNINANWRNYVRRKQGLPELPGARIGIGAAEREQILNSQRRRSEQDMVDRQRLMEEQGRHANEIRQRMARNADFFDRKDCPKQIGKPFPPPKIGEQCNICMEPMVVGQKINQCYGPCYTWYHMECIDNYYISKYGSNIKCPSCRGEWPVKNCLAEHTLTSGGKNRKKTKIIRNIKRKKSKRNYVK
jgi:hypothetical protein